MCGIVGYIGNKDASSILLKGLEKLEYRGYDSAGIATLENSVIKRVRSVGKIKNLKQKVNLDQFNSTRGISHTRWATHGSVTKENTHPHTA
ncbi:MAG: glutamine--fructose-6-phosphate aminotransferase, partial [Parcubacteria group bacterium QH_9_35_7]